MRARLVLSLAALGCQEYSIDTTKDPVPLDETDAPVVDTDVEPPEPEVPTDDREWITQAIRVDGDPPLDILFALDKSCSMSSEVWALGNAFSGFIRQVGAATSDWHIGVVTQDDGCFNGGWIDAQTPNYTQRFLNATRDLGLFGGTDLQEALLALSDAALAKAVPGRCNAGFTRPDAALHVIAISDEPEQSGTPWDAWLASYEARYDVVVVSSVIDVNDQCGTRGDGYREITAATGGLELDVCTSAWGRFAADLGDASAFATRIIVLEHVPDVATIRVRVAGVEISAWTWDAGRNAVILDENPPTGARVDVAYKLPLPGDADTAAP